MNEKEFEFLKKHAFKQNIISVDDLFDKSNRTLLYGYTCERDTWHVYLKDGVITTLLYSKYNDNDDFENEHVIDGETYKYVVVDVGANSDYVPDKRIYPNACDFEFCKLILENGGHLPFTGVAVDGVETKQYYGLVI